MVDDEDPIYACPHCGERFRMGYETEKKDPGPGPKDLGTTHFTKDEYGRSYVQSVNMRLRTGILRGLIGNGIIESPEMFCLGEYYCIEANHSPQTTH